MTDELKPCPNPWCDARRPPVLVWDLYHRHVQCDCGVRGPSSDHRSLDGVPHDVINAEAITAWNTRADLDAAEAKLAQGIVAEYDDGSRVSLSAYAGGASEGGAWSHLTLMKEEQDVAVSFRRYTADGDWRFPLVSTLTELKGENDE